MKKRTHRSTTALLAVAAALGVTGLAQADFGGDPSFGGDSEVVTDFGGFEAGGAMAIQPDGKIVVAGTTDPDSDPTLAPSGAGADFAVARYNTDGSLDGTFSDDGKLTTDFGGQDLGSAVAIQADGKIVVGGTASAGSVNAAFALARYNPNGSLDSSGFGTGGKVITDVGSTERANALALAPGGKIVLAGRVFNSNYDFAVARYKGDGTLDTGFGTGGIQSDEVGGGGKSDEAHGVAVQSNGAVVVVGETGDGSASGTDFALVRYTNVGALDSSFSGDGRQTTDFSAGLDRAYAVAIQPDSKIVLAGLAVKDSHDFALARYDSNGSLDGSFGTGGKVTSDLFGGSFELANAITIQSDGKLVVAGGSSQGMVVVRYTPEGPRDPSFSTVTRTFGKGGFAEGRGVAVQTDGKIVAAGTAGAGTPNPDFAAVRVQDVGEDVVDPDDEGGGGSTPVPCPQGNSPGVICQSLADGGLRITGTNGDDRLVGTDGPDVLVGGPGDDTLTGAGGEDQIVGGPGNDDISGGSGDDTIEGDEGNDDIEGGGGNDRIVGGAGNDVIDGGPGRDKINGSAGSDRINGGSGNDVLAGDAGKDTLRGSAGKDRLVGGGGPDVLKGGSDNDTLLGGGGKDRLSGATGRDVLRGGKGNDRLTGGAANDKLFGNGGNDGLFGGAGKDLLKGGGGADRLVGGPQRDKLRGGPGKDRTKQ